VGQLLDRRSFAAALHERIAARRSFGAHPLWQRISQGRVDRPGLQRFAVQFFLQVREFPRAVSALHTACPHPKERRMLAESLYEEETGLVSGCGLPHPELFIRFGEGVGLHRDALLEGEPLPGTAALIGWFREATRERSFLEGAAAINLAAEGQVPGAFGPFARALEKHYGLSREAVSFWDVHEIADREHSDVGDHIVVHFADTPELQRRVSDAVETSLDRWYTFFDDIDRSLARTDRRG
jgi:pyrroloquinoline-quinone synthase